MIFDVSIRLLALGTNLSLGVLAYRRNSKHATNVLLALLTITIAFWGIANEFSVQADTVHETLFWARAVMVFAVPLTVFFFLLVTTFPRSRLRLGKRVIWSLSLLTIATMGVAASPYLFSEINSGVGIDANVAVGPGIILFAFVTVGSIFAGIYSLIRKNWVTEKTIEKLQSRYLLTGAFTMFALIIGFILFPVIVQNNGSYIPYSVLYTIPFVVATTYAIVRHRLMDIRLALFRGLSLTFLIGAVLLVYGAIVLFAVPTLAEIFEISANILAAGAALISIPIAQYIQQILTKLTDRFLFQNRVDYKKALVDIGQALSGTIDIQEVTNTIMHTMQDIVRSRKVIISLLEKDKSEFVPHSSFGAGKFDISIPVNHALVKELRGHQNVLMRDEEQVEVETETNLLKVQQEKTVINAFEWLDAAVAIPLIVNKELTGIIFLGEKKSGEPYLQDDAEFLNALAPQAATALENARLYEEAQKFNIRLKREIEEATHELEQANVQLKNLDKAKSEFLSIASHQLYTPLTALRGYVSMMQDGDFGKIPTKQVPVLDILEKSATRLIELIKNLLDISRIESGRLELKLESMDLVEMAKELVADLMPNAMNKGLKLEFHEPTTPVKHAVADQQRLRQVMLNFIDNAIKYTPSGRIDVYVYQKGDFILFSVKDTGKGIKKDEIVRLFNKFTRVGGASRFHTEGTGLGLYVARQIVREHHGEVHVDSPGEGKGSTFSLVMPVEGTGQSLHVGEHASVVIKAAEAQAVDKG